MAAQGSRCGAFGAGLGQGLGSLRDPSATCAGDPPARPAPRTQPTPSALTSTPGLGPGTRTPAERPAQAGLRSREGPPVRAGAANGDCREGHGLEANGQRGCDLVFQVRVDQDAPLPGDQRGKEQCQQEPDELLLGALPDDALGAVGVGVVAVPDEELLVRVARALLEAVQGPHQASCHRSLLGVCAGKQAGERGGGRKHRKEGPKALGNSAPWPPTSPTLHMGNPCPAFKNYEGMANTHLLAQKASGRGRSTPGHAEWGRNRPVLLLRFPETRRRNKPAKGLLPPAQD